MFGWLTFDQLGEEFDYSMDEMTLLEQVGKRLGLYLSRRMMRYQLVPTYN
ncbi:hypothetical protein RCO48_35795 [Peribacillus frigoritolerans]|nr:hypothetical protein [Peribacillus frigoritolerans]